MPASARTARHEQIYEALDGFLRAVDAAYEGFAQQQNLHPTDVRCLIYLDDQAAAVSPKTIAEQLKLSSGSTTALLDRLEKAGLVRRLPNPADRRSLLIELVEDADHVLPALRRLRDSLHHSADRLSESEVAVIISFLNSLSRSAHELLAEWQQHPTKGQP